MPILHDALTVAVVADPQLVISVPRQVQILPWGFSIARYGPSNARVGSTLDLERFHTMIDQQLLGTPMPLGRPRGLIERLVQLVA